MKDFMVTSESAIEGHPDKICNQISYPIGRSRPVSVLIETYETGKIASPCFQLPVSCAAPSRVN